MEESRVVCANGALINNSIVVHDQQETWFRICLVLCVLHCIRLNMFVGFVLAALIYMES